MDILNIVKIGGNVVDNRKLLSSFLEQFSFLKGQKILVHGGGKIVTRMANSMNIKTEMVNGRRITTDEMIDVATMTFGGLVNKKIVCELQSLGANALGLTGADGNFILADKRPITDSINYGWVGDPTQINEKLLISLIGNGIIPIIAPLTHDGAGHMLNTNADTIARMVAVALSGHFEVELNYCFELNGVLQKVNDPSSLILELTPEKYELLRKEGVITAGMIPKVENAFDAISNGVRAVRIMSHKSISDLQNTTKDEYTIIR
ncbi:MAG: acetylglutamate kinase [Cyclobacteriaceae bacterium]